MVKDEFTNEEKGDGTFTDQYLESLAKDVSSITGVPLRHMKGSCRKFEIALARHLFFYAAKFNKKGYNFSLSEIGGTLNNDHATVLHGIKRIQTELKLNVASIVNMVNQLTYKGPDQYVLTFVPVNLVNLVKKNEKITQLKILNEYIV